MRTLPLQTLRERAEKNAYRMEDLHWDGGVDAERCFFPEHMTAFWFTPWYEKLGDEERVTYNQWYALAVAEQFIFLEQVVLIGYTSRMLDHPDVKSSPDLRAVVEQFIAEEHKHSAIFRRLLRLSAPDLYEKSDNRFFTPGPLNRSLARFATTFPSLFIAAPLIAMALEEKTIAFYREYEKVSAERPGQLDALHHEVHRYHMLDETRHVHIDEHLMRVLWDRAPRWKQQANVPFLFRTLAQYTTPRRRSTNVNIIRALCRRFPRLAAHEDEMVRAVLALRDDERYQARVNGRSSMPRTFAMFDEHPELRRGAARATPAYQAPAGAAG